MLFTSPPFLLFALAFFLLNVALGDRQRARLYVITLGSLLFYATWHVKYLPFLVGIALLDFACAFKIDESQRNGRTGKGWLVLSIVTNLSVLSAFKYVDFLMATGASGLQMLGLDVVAPHLDLVLPVGISFYTFQSMSYTIDVYRKSTHARRHPLSFLAALSFFPHLAAGPIVRGAQLIPQFERGPLITRERLHTGLLLIAAGIFKKTVGDLVGPLVNDYYNGVTGHGALAAWTGVVGFAAQIYADFAGYSDIAIGLALLFGYDLPQNFDTPFLATSPTKYWNRWHMSLQTWLRDYVFFPLNKWWAGAVAVPLIATWTLSGLWHGAGWTFILWGAYLGVLLWISREIALKGRKLGRMRGASFVGWIVTFYASVVIPMAMFRASTVSRGFQAIADLHTGGFPTVTWENVVNAGCVLAAIVSCHLLDWLHLRKRQTLLRPWILVPLVVFCFAFAFTLGAAQTFIYFQF